MKKADIISIFHNCIFDGELTEFDYEEKILDLLPKYFEYTYNYGASKLVIQPKGENFVIKIPFTGYFIGDELYEDFTEAGLVTNNDCNEWDYCLTEVEVYSLAAQQGIEKIFCKTELIGDIENHPIYIQELATVFRKRSITSPDSEEKINKTMKKLYNMGVITEINKLWLSDVYLYFGDILFDTIFPFISEINDLHDGNIGYIGDRPVIFDYSGYCS